MGKLTEIEERAKKATDGPWFDNSYSAIFTADEKIQEANRKLNKQMEDAGWPDENKDPWRSRINAAETCVAHVPPIAGDTSVGRHYADMEFIAHSREDIPYLLSLLRSAEEALKMAQMMICHECDYAIRLEGSTHFMPHGGISRCSAEFILKALNKIREEGSAR